MKKIISFLLMLSFIASVTSACAPHKQKPNMIQSKRRFEKYVSPQAQQQSSGSSIDLSEGPKTNYNHKLGPNDLNFDVKIVDPYSFNGQ